jgi:DNA-binding CsgD family transcriptional regulator
MKGRITFPVPITPRIGEILSERLAECKRDDDLLFPCWYDRPVGNNGSARDRIIRRQTPRPFKQNEVLDCVQSCAPDGEKVSLHGIARSNCGDWLLDQGFDHKIVDSFLAHKTWTQTQRAYFRKDLPRRRELGEAWETFCCSAPVLSAEVVPLGETATETDKIVAMKATGAPAAFIAQQLGISRRTVKAVAQNEQIVAMRLAGEKPIDIAHKLGITRRAVYEASSGEVASQKGGVLARADRIIAMKEAGKPVAEIARELGITKCSAYRIIRDRQAGKDARWVRSA